jgi:beta-lactamase class A
MLPSKKQGSLLCLLIIVFSFCVCAQKKQDKKLDALVKQTIENFHGDVGVYIKNLRTQAELSINGDTIFPTASIVKVPILIGIMDKIERGELTYDQPLQYKDSLLYEGEDILGSFKSGEIILLKKVLMLMLTTSDNTASLWLQSLAGTGTRINQILDSLNFKATRVNSRTPGREPNRSVFGWGQTTPREMGKLFERIYTNEVFSPAACDRMMRSLSRSFWDVDEGISQIPPYVSVFSKNGCVDESRSEVMLVNAPGNPYILCVFTKNNQDTTWQHGNEAWTMTRKLSGAVWRYFMPHDHWQPPAL